MSLLYCSGSWIVYSRPVNVEAIKEDLEANGCLPASSQCEVLTDKSPLQPEGKAN